MLTRLNPTRRSWALGEVNGTLSLRSLPPQGPSTELWSQKQAHHGCISALVFSPDGQHVATGGRDGQVHLWHVATGERIRTFTHGAKVSALCWSADGTCLTSFSGRCVRIWPVQVLAQRLQEAQRGKGRQEDADGER